jgi:hypothetical protein
VSVAGNSELVIRNLGAEGYIDTGTIRFIAPIRRNYEYAYTITIIMARLLVMVERDPA